MSIMDKFSVVTFPWGKKLPTIEGCIRMAQHAEKLGFYSIHMPMETTQGKPYDPDKKVKDVFDSLVFLGPMLLATKKIRVGPDGITLPFLPPYYWAQHFATLDHMSGGGRLLIGMCPAFGELQFASVGMSDKLNKRGRMSEEQMEIITRLWTEDEVSFEGEFYKLEGVCCEPKPIEKPHPPIWFAGAERSIDRAARFAECIDIFLPTFDEIRDVYVPRLQAAREKYGTKTELGSWMYSYITPDREMSGDEKEDYFGLLEERGKSSADLTVSGSPQQCADMLRAYMNAGIKRFVMDFQRHGPDPVEVAIEQMTYFKELVVPLLE